jgi:hypothetical protein
MYLCAFRFAGQQNEHYCRRPSSKSTKNIQWRVAELQKFVQRRNLTANPILHHAMDDRSFRSFLGRVFFQEYGQLRETKAT